MCDPAYEKTCPWGSLGTGTGGGEKAYCPHCARPPQLLLPHGGASSWPLQLRPHGDDGESQEEAWPGKEEL